MRFFLKFLRHHSCAKKAFSLVEISIVLVILGLLVGGVISGAALIESAAIRKQINQVDQYKTAMLSFKAKYFYLPGDIPNGEQFGLHPRLPACPAFGNGDGKVQGIHNSNGPCSPHAFVGPIAQNGEALMFWQDLQKTGFISGNFTLINSEYRTNTYDEKSFYPPAAIATQSLVVWSGGVSNWALTQEDIFSDGKNYFALITAEIVGTYGENLNTSPGIMVGQAHKIDSKIDDGLPQAGEVFAAYPTFMVVRWAAGGGLFGASTQTCCAWASGQPTYNKPTTVATPYASTNCYDNNNTVGEQRYSLRNENAKNCALSFRL